MEGDQETSEISTGKPDQTDTVFHTSRCCSCRCQSMSEKQDTTNSNAEKSVEQSHAFSEDNKDLKPGTCHDSHNTETCTCTCSKLEQSESSDSPAVDSDCESTRNESSQNLRKFLRPKHQSTVRAIDEKKNKLRTSKDIYDRLKWDFDSILIPTRNGQQEALDLPSVYVGYKDRFLGMCELAYDEFQPGGDIPFHRIYYFRTGGPPIEPFIGKDGEVKVRHDNLPEMAVFIWDRDSRTDLVFKSGNSTFLKKV